MTLRRRSFAFAFVLALSASAVGEARADNAQDAEALYQQGMELLRDKKLDAACNALERSEKAEARGGTLLSLAYCHEQQGRFALAYSEYDESLRRLRVGGGRRDREQFATERMEAVRDKVVFVSVELGPNVTAPNPEIFVTPSKAGDPERKLILGADRAKQVALDPDGGTYRIEVRAVDRKPFTTQVQVAGKTANPPSIHVPELETTGAVAGNGAVAPGEPPKDGSGQRTLGLVLGGSGIALAAVGGVFGVLAVNCASDVRNAPPGTEPPCSRTTAKTVYANIANAGIGLGAVGVVAGAYLYFSAPAGGPERSVAVRPALGPQTAGLSIDGRF